MGLTCQGVQRHVDLLERMPDAMDERRARPAGAVE